MRRGGFLGKLLMATGLAGVMAAPAFAGGYFQHHDVKDEPRPRMGFFGSFDAMNQFDFGGDRARYAGPDTKLNVGWGSKQAGPFVEVGGALWSNPLDFDPRFRDDGFHDPELFGTASLGFAIELDGTRILGQEVDSRLRARVGILDLSWNMDGLLLRSPDTISQRANSYHHFSGAQGGLDFSGQGTSFSFDVFGGETRRDVGFDRSWGGANVVGGQIIFTRDFGQQDLRVRGSMLFEDSKNPTDQSVTAVWRGDAKFSFPVVYGEPGTISVGSAGVANEGFGARNDFSSFWGSAELNVRWGAVTHGPTGTLLFENYPGEFDRFSLMGGWHVAMRVSENINLSFSAAAVRWREDKGATSSDRADLRLMAGLSVALGSSYERH